MSRRIWIMEYVSGSSNHDPRNTEEALRIGPNEVHVYDPRFYHELYRLGNRYYKDPSMHKVLGAPSSTLTKSDPVRYKQRRAHLELHFAKKNILKLDPMLIEYVDYCCQRFDEHSAAGKSISIEWALKSLAIDRLIVNL